MIAMSLSGSLLLMGGYGHTSCSESMIHTGYTEICNGNITFFPVNMPPPKRILDIGTGVGE